MLRIVGGVVAGLLAAFAVIMAIEYFGHAIYPLPADAALRDPEAPVDALSMPLPVLLIVVFAWFTGALIGGAVAKRINGRWWSPWLVAGMVALGGILAVTMMPHPTWMQIAAVAAPLLGGLFASHAVWGDRKVADGAL
jgi:hypothetical protein